MKQSLLMLMVLAVSLPWAVVNPFAGLMVYYALAVVRPQALWAHALPDWRFSLLVGAATLIGYVCNGCARSAIGRRWPIEKILVAVLAVLTVLSTLTAVNRGMAMHQMEQFLKIFVMFFVACGLLDSRQRLRVLAMVIALGLGYWAADFNQRYLLLGWIRLDRLVLDQLDNNGLAALMVLGLPFCLFLWATERRWYLRWPPLALLVLMVHYIMLSMSRGGMLGALVVIPLVLLRMRRKAAGVLLLVLLALVGVRLAGPMVRQRFFSIEQYEADRSATYRIEAWRTAWRVCLDNPWLGVGPLGYAEVSKQYRGEDGIGTVHNQFLQTAADKGLPAMLALVGALGLAMWHLQGVRRGYHGDPFMRELAGCVQASLIGYVVVGMFLSLGTIELTYMVLAMAVGMRNIAAVESQPLLAAAIGQRVQAGPAMPSSTNPKPPWKPATT